jgi:peptide-methionine (S)-S-oxide reductase
LLDKLQVSQDSMIKTIILGGGCFWGMQDLLRKKEGIVSTIVGYAGGSEQNPTYENHTGHAEVVQVEYDDSKIQLKNILDFFFTIHDPTTINRQGNDTGTSYRSVIFYATEEEKQIAQDFIDIVNESGRWQNPVVTTLEPSVGFTEAEDYHQDYLVKNPHGYTCHWVRFESYIT